MFLELESDKFGDQASLRNERQNNIHSEDQCPNNHFFQEGTENQGNNPPPASDNECPEYEVYKELRSMSRLQVSKAR